MGKLTTEEFIRRSLIVHRDQYCYNKTNYISQKNKVIITCPIHGDFMVLPNNHLKNRGCKKCGIIKRAKTYHDRNAPLFITKAMAIHGDTYDYSKSVYVNYATPLIIGCKVHGYFNQSPQYHLAGQGCGLCKGTHIGMGRNKGARNRFIDKSKKLHNNKYDYSKTIYSTAGELAIIICPQHGAFSQTPNKHLQGHGCPNCNYSKGETNIKFLLNAQNIYFKTEHTFPDCKILGRMRFDFFIPLLNMLIEYHGQQHFVPSDWFGGLPAFMNLKRNDEYKKRWAIENGYIFKEYTHRDSWSFIENDIIKTIKSLK